MLVVVLQHDELSDVGAVLVAPLMSGVVEEKRPRLHPSIEVSGATAVVMVERMAAINRRELGEPIGSAAERANAIKRALDIALYGFLDLVRWTGSERAASFNNTYP